MATTVTTTTRSGTSVYTLTTGGRGPIGATGPAATVTLASELLLLGITEYANLSAANAALSIGSIYYDTALAKIHITTA